MELSTQTMSPDTVSSLFPDRPIRPLPKRRLRERLSPEAADSIKYPSSTLDSIPLFYYPPYTLKEEVNHTNRETISSVEQPRPTEAERSLASRQTKTGLGESVEEDDAPRSTLVTRSPPEILNRVTRLPVRPDQPRLADPQPPPSAASSVDGYDSFENTNNKKKRKIPSAGDSTLNGAHSLNSDVGSLSISTGVRTDVVVNGERSYPESAGYASSSGYLLSSHGVSGPGRGRLGRSRNGRSPLRTLPDGNSTWLGRVPKNGPPQWPSAQQGSGIISNAIANAEKLPPQGQENVSLLQQHSSSVKATPASTQFTFTCDSQVPGTVQWPGHPTRHGMGTQTTPGMSSMSNANGGLNHDGSAKTTSGGSAHSRRKTRRRLEKELNMAARHRKQLAADANYHSPPKLSDIWICEFCEYERIFGEPPRALIRDYEIKDRRHRQEEADRKRLLEKAKAKSRKGKKMARVPAKGLQPVTHSADQVPGDPLADPGAPPMQGGNSHSTQSEEDYEDEFEENYPNAPPDRHRSIDEVGHERIPSRAKT